MDQTHYPDIPLRPGDRLFFQRDVGGKRVQTAARFIGVKGRDYLISDPPMVRGGPLFVANGVQCVVRFLHEGVLYGFVSNVRHILNNPVGMVFLDYPSNLETVNLRCEKRFTIHLPASVAPLDAENAGAPSQCQLLDISCGGCRVDSPVFFDVGEKISLSCRLGGETEEETLLTAEVRNSLETHEGGYEMGLKFLEKSSQVSASLERLSLLMNA